MKHSRSEDFYKTYKKQRKQMPGEGYTENPKNEYDRRDKNWLKEIDDYLDEDSEEDRR